MADKELTNAGDFPVDASIGGSEIIPVADVTTAKHLTPDLLVTYAIATIQAIATSTTADAGDSLMMLQNDTTLKPVVIEKVQQYIADTGWGKAAETAVADADKLMIKDADGPTEKTVTAAILADYMLAENRAETLDMSTVAGGALTPIVDGTLFSVTDGSTPKSATALVVKTYVFAALAAYLTALNAVVTPADADLVYVTQSGVEKKLTLLQLKTYVGSSITGSGTVDNLAQWDSIDNTVLVAGPSLETSFTTGSDVAVATTEALSERFEAVITDATAMVPAIVDADRILMYDNDVGAQTQAIMSQLYTYIDAKVKLITLDLFANPAASMDMDAQKLLNVGALQLKTFASLTMAANTVAVSTRAWNKIDTSGGASEDLTSVTGLTTGMWYTFQSTNAARDVVFKHQADIHCNGAVDLTLSSVEDVIMAFSPDGTKLMCILIQVD